MAIAGFERSFGQQRTNAPVAKKGNFLTSLIPTAGGTAGALGGAAAGAALGSVVPVVGTAVGGLLGALLGGAGGSAIGKVGENVVEGESDLGKGVAGEALLGGLTSTPLTAGFKLAKAGAKVATGIGKTSAKQLTQEAGQLAIPKRANTLQALAGQEIADTAAGTTTRASGGLANTLRGAATNADTRTSGFGVGQKLKGNTITPERSAELYDFARTNGIKPGTPISQAKSAQDLLNKTTADLDSTLESINRTVSKDEINAINAAAAAKVAEDATITGTTRTLDKLAGKVTNAKDIKALEAIRREADNIAFNQNGAGKTSAAAQARSIRESIDDAITALSPEYKATKGAYVNAKDILELSSKNANSTKGGLNILGNSIGSQVIPGGISKAASAIGGAGNTLVSAGANTTGQGIFGAATRESLLGQRPGLTGDVPIDETLVQDPLAAEQVQRPSTLTGEAMNSNTLTQPAASNPFGISLSDVAAQMTNALSTGDTKGYATLADLYDRINEYESAQNTVAKPLSAEASKTVANATSGLESLNALEGMINQGGVPKGTIVPGRSLVGGLGANVLGTSTYDTTARNIQDVITRLRSGAAITDQEAAFYNSQLPQAFDDPEAIAAKLGVFRDLFSRVANQTGSAGSDQQAGLLNYQ